MNAALQCVTVATTIHHTCMVQHIACHIFIINLRTNDCKEIWVHMLLWPSLITVFLIPNVCIFHHIASIQVYCKAELKFHTHLFLKL